ncbi:MAG: tRNA dihydrouridine synthase DusB [Planctomycetes bacterium]|nr:tRNA dihydrouridine synthase DusB [Planctomycetota bacterium]
MNISPLQIGNLAIPFPVCLAPMSGYTKRPFRVICRRYHCGLVFTEVTNANAIARRAKRTMHFLESAPEERPIAAHIYGANADSLAGAAEVIESLGTFDLIDINCGCPVPKITRKGAGVVLMRDPEKLRDILQAVSSAVSIPVTVKTRTGISQNQCNISEVAHAVEEGGASAIFLHARVADAEHSGPVDLDMLKRIKQERTIPIIGNGGISEPEHASHMLRETGVDGVMVGQAAIGNPWIFDAIHCHLTGRSYRPPSSDERYGVIVEHLHQLHELIELGERSRKRKRTRGNPELAACRRFRAHLVKYLSGIPGWRHGWSEPMEARTVDGTLAAVRAALGARPE